MAKFSVKKALAVVGALTVLGAGVFFGIDAVSDDFNVVFYPDTNHTQPLPEPEPTPTPQPEPGELVQLASPEMVYNQEDNILSWNEVENASGYLVTVDGQEYQTNETQVELNIEENTKYNITLKALGDGEKYKDSKTVSLSGVRQGMNQVYYQQIEDNIYKFFEDYMYAGRNKVEIQDILNIDLQNNVFSVLTKCNDENRPITIFRTFGFDLSNYINFSNNITLKDLAEASNYIKNIEDSYVNVQLNSGETYSFADNLYNKLISDNLLNGNLKTYIDSGYTLTKLYSEPSMGNYPENFIVNSCVKLQKGNDIKVVTIQNKISQKYNTSFAFDGYVNAYIDGTAEDVVIEETAFTEASPVSSLWQAADEKYDGQNMNLSSNQAKSGVKYQSMSYSQNGQNYILTYPVDDFSLEL